jgi:hypothetical protein
LAFIIEVDVCACARCGSGGIDQFLFDITGISTVGDRFEGNGLEVVVIGVGGVPSEREECFFDVDIGFCACFNEWDTKFLGECSALIFRDYAFLGPVAFIPDEDFMDSFCGMLFDVLEPSADVYVSNPTRPILLNDLSSQTSYTKRIPMAPR